MIKLRKFYDSKYFDLFLSIVMIIIPFIIYWNYFSKDMFLAGGDGIGTVVFRDFQNNSLREGEFPFWNKYLLNGAPFVADISTNALYPFNWMFSFLDIKLFMYMYYSFHVMLGSFFTYLYLKEINCKKIVAICVSFMYLFSIHIGGPRKGHMMIIVTIVYLPVILYFVELYFKKNKIKWLIFAAFAMALQFFTAFVQDVLYTNLFIIVYLITFGLHHRMKLKKMITDGLLWGTTYLGLIAVQLLPTIQLLNEYGKYGASDLNIDAFRSYSIHFIKIIMMIFPRIFGNEVYQTFGPYYSSEIDIEIFLGTIVGLFILYGIKTHFSNFRIKFATFTLMGTFIFAAQAHIPLLNWVLFRVPLIGSMRCTSRIIFIFIFFAYVLFAITMSNICENEINAIREFAFKVLIVMIFIIPFAMIFVYEFGFINKSIEGLYDYFKINIYRNLAVIFLVYITTTIYMKKYSKRFNKKYVSIVTILFITAITIYETYPFSSITNPCDINIITGNNDKVIEVLKEDIGNYKVWDDFPAIDGARHSIISQNTSVSKKIPSINAYLSFNNPNIYKLLSGESSAPLNFSGLMTGVLNADENIMLKNDLLSMLGIKYIIDEGNFINEDGSIYKLGNKLKSILSVENIYIPNNDGNIYVYQNQINIKSNKYYKIEMEINKDIADEFIYMDFYSGPSYDNMAQQKNIVLSKNKNKFEGYIYSGEVPSIDNIFFRIVSMNKKNIDIRNLNVSEIETIIEKNIYKPYIINEDVNIYENTRAKDILYKSDYVKNIEDSNNLYLNVFDYDFEKNSYIENYKNIDQSKINTTINIDKFSNNKLSATISSDSDVFINFSQNYYPGWKAFVNGKEVNVYRVNALIQGIEVPSGNSNIEFKFVPKTLISGGIISIITLLVSIYVLNKRFKEN